MTQFLIKVLADQKLKTDKETTISAIEKVKPVEVKEEINLDKFQVTDDLLWGTRIYEGYKLINVIEDISLEDLQLRIDKYKLDWTILAANEGTKIIEIDKEKKTVTNTLIYYNFNEIINYIKRVRVYEKGEFVKEIDPVKIELGKAAGALDFEAQV